MAGPLILAVPAKGRLQENAQAFFARAGLAFQQAGSERTYRARIPGLPGAEVAFLSAGEIARELAAGTVHLGITGRDLVEEEIDDWTSRVALIAPLGFGFADVVVAVPEAWIDVDSMVDLDDVAAEFRPRHGRRLKVATKYLNLTRHFFAGHGIANYRIVESLGATEGAPASGAADLIVDITTTGATLKANGLKPVADGLILASQAHLVASLAAPWGAEERAVLRTILDRIEAEAAAQAFREIGADVADPAAVAKIAAERFGARAVATNPDWPLLLHCPEPAVEACADWLRQDGGARTVVVRKVESIFSAASPAYDRLVRKIDARS
ncbi:MAG: ATP phosphoribosyltransferase [Bauldia sp.]|nr:ATP phosphoribosyltransferase [Bauldia sp.]